MTAAEKAAAVYRTEPCARTFREDLDAHLQHGYVFSTPHVFIMGRAVNSRADAALIVDPWHGFPRPEQDAWLVYLCATHDGGHIADALKFLPHELPLIGFERGNELRFLPFKLVCSTVGFLRRATV